MKTDYLGSVEIFECYILANKPKFVKFLDDPNNTEQIIIHLDFVKENKTQLAKIKVYYYPKEYGKTGKKVIKDIYTENVDDLNVKEALKLNMNKEDAVFWNYVDEIFHKVSNVYFIDKVRKELRKEL